MPNFSIGVKITQSNTEIKDGPAYSFSGAKNECVKAASGY